MPNIFFISDTHFGHKNIITFKNYDGSTLRDFPTVEDMDEHIVKCWNSVVRPVDKVYHLGDVVINRKSLPILERLNGKKRLVKGNHDIFPTKDYLKYFDEIKGVRVFTGHGFICSHIPLHPECMPRWKLNIHGHLHNNTLKDKKYFNVSVERIAYTPIELNEIQKLHTEGELNAKEETKD